MTCSTEFEATLAPKCFETFGVNFQGVIHIISNKQQGAVPDGYTFESFQKFLCSVPIQDKIVPCVLQRMQSYNTSQCADADRMGVFGRGGQLLAFMDQICGEPCEQEATQSLIQCYAAINVNPEAILNPNASIADDKYTVVGQNETEYDNFCSNRRKLFSCLSPLSSTCPGLLERLYTIGVDLEAMEVGTGLLCQDKKKYFKGLQCLTNPSSAVAQCRAKTESMMKTVLMGRYQTGAVPPSQYQVELCKSKLTQVDCEITAFSSDCDAGIADLRTGVECAILPKPCRENPQFKTVYGGICNKQTTTGPLRVDKPTPPPNGPGKTGSDILKSQNNNNGGGGNDVNAAGVVVASVAMVMASLGLTAISW